MNQEIVEISFEIIVNAGEAKSMAAEAIKLSKQGKIDEAREMLEKSKEQMNQAHRSQTALITKEVSGEKVETSVILIHAQDHLMNAMNFQMLAEEFIDLYENLQTQKVL